MSVTTRTDINFDILSIRPNNICPQHVIIIKPMKINYIFLGTNTGPHLDNKVSRHSLSYKIAGVIIRLFDLVEFLTDS
jgi:hypothetical protein